MKVRFLPHGVYHRFYDTEMGEVIKKYKLYIEVDMPYIPQLGSSVDLDNKEDELYKKYQKFIDNNYKHLSTSFFVEHLSFGDNKGLIGLSIGEWLHKEVCFLKNINPKTKDEKIREAIIAHAENFGFRIVFNYTDLMLIVEDVQYDVPDGITYIVLGCQR